MATRRTLATLFLALATGCSERAMVLVELSPTPVPEAPTAIEARPESPPATIESLAVGPSTPAPPFSWSSLLEDGEYHRGAVVATRARRTPELDGEAVRLSVDGEVRVGLFHRTYECEGGGGGQRRGLAFAVRGQTWLIRELASYYTDCAGEVLGYDTVELEVRDVIPGGPMEVLVHGSVYSSRYGNSEGGDCYTMWDGRSERLWVCGIDGDRPVCWASIEVALSDAESFHGGAECDEPTLGPAVNWSRGVTVDDGFLRVTVNGTTSERQLSTLPCLAATPDPAFQCDGSHRDCSWVVDDPNPPLRVRETPSSRAPITAELAQGSAVVLLERRGGWGRTEAGWVWMENLGCLSEL